MFDVTLVPAVNETLRELIGDAEPMVKLADEKQAAFVAKEWRKNKMNNLRFLNLISMLLSVPCLTVPLSKAFAGSSIP